MNTRISTSGGLRGTVTVPGDKSISHRSLMLSALADGASEIHGMLRAADPMSTLSCLQSLGVKSEWSGEVLTIQGNGLHGLRCPEQVLDAGNSGTTIRLLAGILSGQSFSSRITGDDSLRRRPMKRIVEPLGMMGAHIDASDSLTPPLNISGCFPLRPITYRMPVASAQVKSAILLAGLFADGVTTVVEPVRTRDHTERMLGLSCGQSTDGFMVEVRGGQSIAAQSYRIPGDISSAAFLVAAAMLVPDSELLICDAGLNPTRTRILDLFRSIGGHIDVAREQTIAGERIGDLLVRTSDLHGSIRLKGSEAAELIDEIPILAVTAAVAGIDMTVHGAAELRKKESDRIHALVENLRKLGLDVEEHSDGFAFQGKKSLLPAEIDSFSDHRIAMAFGVAGLALKGGILVNSSECVEISFPSFWDVLGKIQRRSYEGGFELGKRSS